MRNFLIISVVVFFCIIKISGFSQNVAINTDHSAANSSAMLDVKSSTKGVLISRMKTASRDAIKSPANGLLIYNISTNEFNYYNGTEWTVILSNFVTFTTGSNSSAGGTAINTVGLPASNSAMLDVSDDNRGVLFPRTTTGSISSPVTGLIIYNTATEKFNYYDGSTWIEPCVSYTGIIGASGTQTAKGVAMNTTAATIDQSAILDVSATNKGVLIPRITSTDRDLILAVNGLFLYNTTTNAIEFYNSSEWRMFAYTPTITTQPINPAAICEGETTNISIAVSGGGTITYQWQYNNSGIWADVANGTPSSAIYTGNTSSTLTVAGISGAGAYQYRCIVSVSGSACDPLTSNTAKVTVNTSNAFITEWLTTSPNESITLPLYSYGASSYNCTVYWGDGTSSTITSEYDADKIHIYATPGTYRIYITGTCEGWSFNSSGDRLKIIKIISWGANSGACKFDGFNFFRNAFYGCSNLTDLGTGSILASGSGCTYEGFIYAFADCSSLTTIPDHLFDKHTSVSGDGFSGTFNNCSALTSIPDHLFDNCPSVSGAGFSGTFTNCISLTSIPDHLFDNCPAVSASAFSSTFAGCHSLSSIPVDLFKYNTAVSSSGFAYTFSSCWLIKSIPSGLFNYNTNVSTMGFMGTFMDCISLASIPVGLFDNNIAVSTYGFASTFMDCRLITTIPVDLFKYNTAVSISGFSYTFGFCLSLATVPANLFRYNTSVSTSGFEYTFINCNKLQLNRNIFFADGEEGTRFLNKESNFTNCFWRTGFSGTQGEAPALWNCNFGTGTLTTTSCYGGTGNSTTSLINYNNIPDGTAFPFINWK